ncbi:MAG: hypothetical protein LBB68_08180 [Treponema sp.]|jgi:hypothetical protein|nr:hypothetical protein [Treponema sp.]
MKRISVIVLFMCTLSLRAQDKPHRLIELGFDAGASIANSYLIMKDILRETVTLDLSQMDDLYDGFSVLFNAHGKAFINVNLGVSWGFGLFAGADAMGQFKIPQSMVELLARGNDLNKSYSDDLGLGAAAFLETGFWTSLKFRRIKFTVQPAYYVPLAYLGKPTVHYSFCAGEDGTISVHGKYKAELYTPISLGDAGSLDIGSILSKDSLDIGNILSKGGIDISLRAEYPLYYNLILGGTITHIPFFPAQLSDKYSISGSFGFPDKDGKDGKDKKNIIDIINGKEDAPELIMNPPEKGNGNKIVLRPLKVGVDAVYRPFRLRLLAVKPNLALVFNSIYDIPVYADFGLTGELNLADIFILGVGTRYEDLVWKQRANLVLNFRVIELGIGISTQSQQFLKSFQGAGLGVDVGFRMGF